MWVEGGMVDGFRSICMNWLIKRWGFQLMSLSIEFKSILYFMSKSTDNVDTSKLETDIGTFEL